MKNQTISRFLKVCECMCVFYFRTNRIIICLKTKTVPTVASKIVLNTNITSI